MNTTNFTPKTGLFAQDSTSTCSIEKVAMLEEMKALYNKGELSEADAERWNFLCESLYNGNFREFFNQFWSYFQVWCLFRVLKMLIIDKLRINIIQFAKKTYRCVC